MKNITRAKEILVNLHFGKRTPGRPLKRLLDGYSREA